MADDIFIGVDGGATKTTVRIEDHRGCVIGQGTGGPANIRLSVEQSWESIYHALQNALKQSAIQLTDSAYRFHLGLGLAGCEISDDVKKFLSQPHSFASIQLFSDAHAACLGAHGGKDGAIIVIGTGVVGYQIEQNQSMRVGGWGFPQDDEGGGAWLGLEAARHTFQWLDKRIEKSPLTEDVFEFFNHDFEKFTTWANRANSSEFARLAPLVIKHVKQKENLSVHLIKRAAKSVDKIAKTLIKFQQETLPCSLFGGIAPFVEPWLCEEVRASLVLPEREASYGAILMVRENFFKSEKTG
ncbi:MAG TPA: BadF/BadG/BcrA/BcrD ATPase family protein [Gammaproteobacteria bacterium]|nr:BadF/BadG/BcrA/BcrD ATPase family protein [Gammaproteobacteria bacterium]